MPAMLRLFILPMVLLAAAVAPAAAATPQWLWSSETARPGEVALFRKTFEISPPLESAVLTLAADNTCAVRVNGEMVVHTDAWQRPHRENIAGKLKPGKNELTLFCANVDGPAGLAARLVLKSGNGPDRNVEIVTDDTWEVSSDPQRAWKGEAAAWAKPFVIGKLGIKPWGDLNLSDNAPVAMSTAIDAIDVPEGFTVDLIHSVPRDQQGSWVSLTTDPQGRLIACDQYGGLFRITPGAPGKEDETKVEPIDLPIGDAQGLLCAFDSLYVVVNGGGNGKPGSGLYRLRDTDGDDQYDKLETLREFKGSGEHGPHAIRLGADGRLWIIAGNHTEPPVNPAADPAGNPDSPLRNFTEDLLLTRNPDGNGHATGRMAPGGWIANCNADGGDFRLFSAGFRNPYDFAFNADGEMFAYDADMEWDTGTPWYRPTRVNHAVSAAEFGWRYGTGKWPEYYPDSLGSVTDIGLGSPTGVEAGTGLKAPAKWQRAIFIADWTYGKVYAVHPQADGAGYTAKFEVFIEGRPFPATDLAVNPHDGCLYATIGGRKMQSGLYRIRYIGDESTAPVGPEVNAAATKARATRHALEAYHTQTDPAALDLAWPYLNSTDRHLRYAARVAVERQPLATWKAKALAEPRSTAAIQAMVALSRAATAPDAPKMSDADQRILRDAIVERLLKLPLGRMTETQIVDAARAYGLAFIRLGGPPDSVLRDRILATIDPLVPAGSEPVNRELTKLLVYLNDSEVVGKSLARLAEARDQQDQMFYVFTIRTMTAGWTPELRATFFNWLNLADQKGKGGASFRKFIAQIRADAKETMTPEQIAALGPVVEGELTAEPVSLETTRQFVHNWQKADLAGDLAAVERGRDFESGKQAYAASQCAKCHRFVGEGGDTGPDITGVGARFNPEYLLESLVEPSKAVSDQYKNVTILTVNGEVFTGRVINETPTSLFVRTDPFARNLTEVKKADVEEQLLSPTSEMPQGLINTLTKDEVLDLLAYLRSAGNASDRAFSSGR